MAKGRRNFKRREDERSKYRINRQIRVPEVRLVGNNLEEISAKLGETIATGIFKTREVINMADRVDMDVVEISAKAKPPVVRITDFSKFLYEKKKKEKEIKAKAVKTVIKEIRFGPNTDDHDFEFKLRHAQKFLEDGAKVKAYVQFRGRTIVFKDRGMLLLLRFIKELEEFGIAEALPKMEGRRMFVFIAPKKTKKATPKPKKERPPRKPKPIVVKKEQPKEKQPIVEAKDIEPIKPQPLVETRLQEKEEVVKKKKKPIVRKERESSKKEEGRSRPRVVARKRPERNTNRVVARKRPKLRDEE